MVSFLFGIVISIPAYYIEKGLITKGVSSTFGGYLKEAFLWVALPEEVLKFLAFFIVILIFKKIKIPSDYVLMALAISLGFATLENSFYGIIYGYETTLLRSFTAVPAHACFGIFLGFGYSLFISKSTNLRLWVLAVITLLSVVIIHGVYDFFIIQQISENLLLGSLLVLVLYIILSIYMVKLVREYNNDFLIES